MKRGFDRLAAAPYDLLVVGGGITGACIARDAARRGLKVAIVDKGDWSAGTSAATSKLVHGGLRYLKNLEFGLIRESLAERRVWQRIAGHMVRPLPFLLPLHGKGRTTLALGLTLYDLLSFDRAWLDDPASRIPAHRALPADEALKRAPVLAHPKLSGAMLYYDCQSYAPERLGLECVIDAVEHGADAANYAEAGHLVRDGSRIAGAEIRCALTGRTVTVGARLTVNAAGPWADRVMADAAEGSAARRILRSKGIHAIVRPLTEADALTLQTASGGHLFVLPWRGRSIIGTTDTAYDGDPDAVGVSARDLDSLLADVNGALPAARLKRTDVDAHYAGLRPLVDDGKAAGTYAASRRAEIVDHAPAEGIAGLISAIGGKWTTARHIAEQAVDLAAKKLGLHPKPVTTATEPLPGGRIGAFGPFLEQSARRFGAYAAASIGHCARLYGARLDAVMDCASGPEDAMPLSTITPDIPAAIRHAVRAEMAMTLADVVMRRTGLGAFGHPGREALDRAAAIMAAELGWDSGHVAREITAVEALFALKPEAVAA